MVRMRNRGFFKRSNVAAGSDVVQAADGMMVDRNRQRRVNAALEVGRNQREVMMLNSLAEQSRSDAIMNTEEALRLEEMAEQAYLMDNAEERVLAHRQAAEATMGPNGKTVEDLVSEVLGMAPNGDIGNDFSNDTQKVSSMADMDLTGFVMPDGSVNEYLVERQNKTIGDRIASGLMGAGIGGILGAAGGAGGFAGGVSARAAMDAYKNGLAGRNFRSLIRSNIPFNPMAGIAASALLGAGILGAAHAMEDKLSVSRSNDGKRVRNPLRARAIAAQSDAAGAGDDPSNFTVFDGPDVRKGLGRLGPRSQFGYSIDLDDMVNEDPEMANMIMQS